MNIGFDLHHTIDKFPQMFKLIMDDYLSSGHNVYVISGSEKESIKNELLKYEIDDSYYTDVFSVIEFLRDEQKVEGHYVNNNWYCDNDIWWPSKAQICDLNNIDILIDDKKEYRQYFDINHRTRFILMNHNLTTSIRTLDSLCKIKSLVFN